MEGLLSLRMMPRSSLSLLEPAWLQFSARCQVSVPLPSLIPEGLESASQGTVPHALRSTNPYPGLWGPCLRAHSLVLFLSRFSILPTCATAPPGHSGEASQEQWTHRGVDHVPVYTMRVLNFPQPPLPLEIPPTNSDPSHPSQRHSHPLPPEVMWQTKKSQVPKGA